MTITAQEVSQGLAFIRAAEDHLRLAKHHFGNDQELRLIAGQVAHEVENFRNVLVGTVEDLKRAEAGTPPPRPAP